MILENEGFETKQPFYVNVKSLKKETKVPESLFKEKAVAIYVY